MADHLTSFWLFYNSAWNEVTRDVQQLSDVTTVRGGSEVSEAPKPNSLKLTLQDQNGVYRPHSPASPLYGLAGRYTPMMMGSLVTYEDFEDASLNITIGAGSSVNPWARSTTSPHTGTWCLKSGATADSAFSDAIITVPSGANVCTLWYRTDCQSTDVIRISTGGYLRAQVGGTGGTWTYITVPVMENTVGAQQVYVRYLKDASGTGGADAVYIDDVSFYRAEMAGEVSSWSPDRTVAFDAAAGIGSQWTDLDAQGLLGRIGKWTDQLQSAYVRSISQFATLLGFWPGEDGREATAMSNLTPGGLAAPTVGVTFGDSESPGGGSTSMKLPAGAQVEGEFLAGSESGWQISWAFKLPTVPAPGPLMPIITWEASDGKTWTLYIDDTTFNLTAETPTATFLDNFVTFGAGSDPDQWISMRLKVSLSGGTVTWELAWYPEGFATTYGTSGTYASATIGHPTRWFVNANANIQDGWFGYLFATTGIAEDLQSPTMLASFNGHPGERAEDRFGRLMLEAGLSAVVRGSGLGCEVMGTQRPGRLIDLLREIQQTDAGVLCDFEGMPSISYRLREDLYAQDPALELTFGLNVAPPVRAVLDDLNTHNVITVNNRDGGLAVAEDSTSIVGTLPPPLGAGRAERTVDVNVFAQIRLPELASWWKTLGTSAEPRYSSITVDLDANPELTSAVEALIPGDRVTIANLEPDLVDLLLVGVQDKRQTQKRRVVTLLCVPYRPYNVAIYDDTTRRYDSRTSTTNTGFSTTDTTIVVTFADLADAWSLVNEPYDWVISGERITVTSMGAVSGSGPWTQSATVTRSVNGVVKTHAAGEPIHMHPDQQARYAL